MNLWTIFLTGLTTGGLSCLAVQGGLLTSAIANQKDDKKNKTGGLTVKSKKAFLNQTDWLPASMFLIGKLISHTIFGFFLGFLGSRLELSLPFRLFFQFLAAIYMFATAMNLLQVHSFFRYFMIQPPKFLTRMVRNSSKSKAVFTPFLLGLLTLLIPCGVTQSMEVLAITSESPFLGAMIMLVFVLGTSPLFGMLGIGITKLSESWNRTFINIASILLVYLSLSSINGILVVIDSPYTFQKILADALNLREGFSQESTLIAEKNNGYQDVLINIVNRGYSPNYLQVKEGIPVKMTLVTDNTYSCASDFVFPSFNLRARLGPNDRQTLTFTPTQKGRFTFSCSMGMYSGILEVI